MSTSSQKIRTNHSPSSPLFPLFPLFLSPFLSFSFLSPLPSLSTPLSDLRSLSSRKHSSSAALSLTIAAQLNHQIHQKIDEFVAHTATATCLRISSKSGRVMVTGGEDRKVNLWAVGKTVPVLVRLCLS